MYCQDGIFMACGFHDRAAFLHNSFPHLFKNYLLNMVLHGL